MIEVLVTTILDSKPIVQAFEKIPALKVMAPTQTEPPFKFTQLGVWRFSSYLQLSQRSGFVTKRPVRPHQHVSRGSYYVTGRRLKN